MATHLLDQAALNKLKRLELQKIAKVCVHAALFCALVKPLTVVASSTTVSQASERTKTSSEGYLTYTPMVSRRESSFVLS